MTESLNLFIVKLAQQSPIVENNQQDNNTNKVVETTNQNKDEVNEKNKIKQILQ